MTRLVSSTAFAAAALAFVLPFGAVSRCGGSEVRSTGAELATFSVTAEDPADEELRAEVERTGGPPCGQPPHSPRG